MGGGFRSAKKTRSKAQEVPPAMIETFFLFIVQSGNGVRGKRGQCATG